MPIYSDKTIEEIKRKLSIVDVASSYTQIYQKSGKPWIKCPFHGNGQERTPSCKLDIESSRYYCFGCHATGTMFNFVMEMEHLTFPESVEFLAEKAGVELEKTDKKSSNNNKEREERDALFDLYDRLTKTFSYMLLKTESGKRALDYLRKRKISDETISRFSLGYAPQDPKWLYDFLKSKSYSDDALKKSGLFSSNHYPYPLFANRLMFPVKNWQGKIVAFGARDLSFRENAPKYINTPETIIYSKKHNLYAFYEGLDVIKKEKSVIVCEGNFDAISLQQSGIRNAVAPFGTAFTSEQADLICRYCSHVDLLFDSDGAGQKATEKAIVMLQEKNIEVGVLRIEGAKDASELLETKGEEAVKNILLNKQTGFSYLVNNGLNLYNIRTPKGKSDFVSYLKDFINATQSQVEKESYVQRVSELLSVGQEQIYSDLNRNPVVKKVYENPIREEQVHFEPLNTSAISLDLYLMLIFANHRELFSEYTKVLNFGDLKDKEAQMIFVALENMRRSNMGTSDEIFLSLFADERVRNDVNTSFELEEFRRERPQVVIDEILDRLSLRKKEEERQLISAQLKQGEQDGIANEDLKTLLNEKFSIEKEILELKDRLFNDRRVVDNE